MKILVQKFGGTSVATQERREMIADKVETALKNGFFPVVVVSAIGRCGDPYATDTLINLAKAVGCETNPREMDLLMSCGEIISSVVMVNTLRKRGYESVALTGAQAGIITDDSFGDAEVLRVETKNIYKYIDKNIIPVITGFQGVDENGDITTLGRGGSDVSGSIIGEALNAEAVEIYTDVEGVMTADPRIVPDARVMNTIFYNEVFQMAEYGANVIHPRAVEVAMRSNIPMLIKNTMSDSPGTLITNYDRNRKYKENKKDKIITAVAQIGKRTQVRILYDGSAGEYEDDSILFDMIANNSISLDMINVYPDSKVFIIDDSQLSKLQEILGRRSISYEYKRNCSKVTIIGNKMRGVPGVMAKVIRALSKYNIEILQTSDSHTTISCLIDSEYVNQAVNALHQEFELGKISEK
ncbi:MAG: aspartate kinase [Clostridiales bacterium GWB2_37_7]|nr:MAG: aspartate kinase [Clostridiales bacterium GWB2_37_7]